MTKTPKPLDPSHPAYWEDVKRRTKFRKATAIAQAQKKQLRASMIYEQYVADHANIIEKSAAQAGIKDPSDLAAYKDDCANWMGIPELATESLDQIQSNRAEAVRCASIAMYED